MASALQTQILGLSNIVAYWPLEAGSGTDYGPNGYNLTVNANLGTNGTVLAAGGNPSTVFSNAYQAVTTASMPSPAAPFTVFAFMNVTTFPTYYPTLLGFSSNTNTMSVPHNQRFSVGFGASGQIAVEALQTNTTYMLAYTYDGNQIHMYVNGRWSRNQLISGTTFTSPSKFFIGANSGTYSGTFNIGHVGVFSRTLSSSELFSLFQAAVSGVQTLPTFTDIFTLVNDPMPAVNTVNTAGGYPSNNQGYGLSGTPVRPGLLDTISGHPVIGAHPSPTLLACAGSLCGGYIRANEQHVTLSDGRAMHVACAQLDHPAVATPIIANIANPTLSQYHQAATRMLRDQLTYRTIKTAGQGTTSHVEKGHYLSIAEQDNTSTFHPATVVDYDFAGAIGDETIYGISALSAATLHRYYKLPKNSWTRRYVESVIDTTFDLFLSPNGYFDDGVNDDFYVSSAMQAFMLIAPWMDQAKITKWVNNFILIGNHWTNFLPGPSQQAFYIPNANRLLDAMCAMYMLYLITGNQRWLRVYEMEYQIFFGGMVAVPGVTTPPPAGTYTHLPAPSVAGDWTGVGGTTNVGYEGGFYGFTVVQAPTQADGSDGIGFLGEADSEAPGFDQNYTAVQMGHISRLMAWTNYDPRWVVMQNMLFNALWPYVDTVGSQILWQTGNAAGTANGTATNNPAWSVNTQLGSRQYPQAYQNGYCDPNMFLFYFRGMRSSYPSVSPSVMNQYANYNASHILQTTTNQTPATQFNTTYGPITAAQLQSSWTAFETFWGAYLQESPTVSDAEWRDLGRSLSIFLMHDPNCPMPRSLGN